MTDRTNIDAAGVEEFRRHGTEDAVDACIPEFCPICYDLDAVCDLALEALATTEREAPQDGIERARELAKQIIKWVEDGNPFDAIGVEHLALNIDAYAASEVSQVRRETLAFLQKHEWDGGRLGVGQCPICSYEAYSHTKNCWLAAEIRKLMDEAG